MRGSVKYQVQELFRKSGINQIGHSKHEAKAAARIVLAEGGDNANWHSMGKQLGIHSYRTADAYRDVWRQVLSFSKEQFSVKDIEKLAGQHLQAFLEQKVADGVASSTFKQYAAGLEKLETALSLYSERFSRNNSYVFSPSIQAARGQASSLQRFSGSRCYENPTNVITAVQDANHRFAAQLQLEGGARIYEIALLRSHQLLGVKADPVTRQDKGFVRVQGKGGKIRNIYLPASTYYRLTEIISKNNFFSVNKTALQADVRQAAIKSQESPSGTHGFRWNWAQARFQEVQRHGNTYEQALVVVSQEMGHQRADITEHYLR